MATSVFETLAAGMGVAASCLWFSQLGHVVRHRKRIVELHRLSEKGPEVDDPRPALAVVVAARDEAETIERAIRSLLHDDEGLRVIAVDDRSTDRTGAILDALALEDDRLRVVHIDTLPDGWLGKTNAMQRGAQAADARYILFTDGDVIFTPGALRRAVALADREKLDHLVVSPDTLTEGVGERLFMALFTLLFAFKAPLGKVNDPKSRASIGIGAFNLVRTETFLAIGGFRRVALSVDDDMRLGQVLKFAGYRNKFVIGKEDVAVRWQVGMRGMIRGLEKNFFAGLDFKLTAVAGGTLVILLLSWGPTLGLFFGPLWTRVVSALGLLATAALLGFGSSYSRIPWWYAFTLPIGGSCAAYALLRSTVLAIKRKGITWRGRLYPLEELKTHVALRNHWLHETWNSTR